jgi:transposase
MEYDHYIALDWAQNNMAVARMTAKAERVEVRDVPSDIRELKLYLGMHKGRKILTFEESTPSQWLYTELRDEVDEILICDPRRNRLLSEGPKTDKIDAEKMVRLLRANLLKPVFHTADQFVQLRKLVSGYEDTVKAGVRLKNQRSAMFRAVGKAKEAEVLESSADTFVLAGLDRGIQSYEAEKKRYEKEFERWRRNHSVISHLASLPGIGTIGAVKIAAAVVCPQRFKNKNKFISYCGLVKHDRMSGGRCYGRRSPQYSRTLKSVFKTAALACAPGGQADGDLRDYYHHLVEEKRYPEHTARHAVARRLAVVALGVMKSGERYRSRREAAEATA